MTSRRWCRRTALVRVLLLAGVGAGACGPRTPVATPPFAFDSASFNKSRAWEEVAAITALGERPSGSDGVAAAAVHLADRFRVHGLDPMIDAFEDPSPRGLATFRNVHATVSGGGSGIIVIGSHYDTKSGINGVFVGANDSASSTGVLLELARLVQAAGYSGSGGPDIVFVAFDGEECAVTYGPNDGFHGSRHMARTLDESGDSRTVRAVIVMDMIGDRDLNIAIPRNSTPALIRLAFRAAEAEGERSRFSLHPNAVGDDHVAFFNRGMPAIDLIDFAYGSRPGANDYWHTENDTLDKLSPESLGVVGRVTVGMLNELIGQEYPQKTIR